MSKTTGSLCAVDGCRKSRKRNKDMSFFHLPADAEKCKTWLELIGRPDLMRKETKRKSYFVCYLHFDPSDISYTPKLKPDAVPKILLPSDLTTYSSSTEANDKSRQTITSASRMLSKTDKIGAMKSDPVQTTSNISKNTPRKRKHTQELMKSNIKQNRLQNEIDVAKQESKDSNSFEVTENFNKLMKWQSYLRKQKCGNRYDPSFKSYALNLKFSSPNTYRSFRTILSLPSESTLHRFKINVPPTLEDRTLEFISSKLKSMPENANLCTLCIDEMDISPHLYYDTKKDEIIGLHNINGGKLSEIAYHACVVMVRGIEVKWHQVVAYSFLGSPKHYARLEQWLDAIILELFNIGIKVKAIVSHQGSIFDKYTEEKRVSKEKPYFLIDDRKIYHIFDVPHLLKSIRNDLLANNFIYENKTISWKYIETIHVKIKENNLSLIPKITDAHVKPDDFQKMSVKYAAQIFSNSVYSAFNILIFVNNLPYEAKATAEFVQLMNNLFDVLNSSLLKPTNKYQKAFSLEKYQLEILKDALEIFQKLRAIDPITGVDNTSRLNTFKSLQITIQSIYMLCKDLKEDGLDYVCTRRFNQDCLNIFFGKARQQGVNNCQDLTPIQFQRAFSKLFLSNMLKDSPTTNCKGDICDLIQRDIGFFEKLKPQEPLTPTSLVSLDGETDYRFGIPTENALIYVSGYLFYKCHKKHTCSEFDSVVQNMPDLCESKLFTQHIEAIKKTSSLYKKLKVPSDDFCNYIRELDTIFTKHFEQNMQQKPGSVIFELLKDSLIPFNPPCSCFPHEYLLKLFVRLRIFNTIKYNNREFRQGKQEYVEHYI